MGVKYELTPEHRAQFEPWAAKWIANALNVTSMDEADCQAMREAMAGLYRAADLEPPKRGIFVSSPMTGAIATGIASGVIWLRAHPEEQRKLFGRVLAEGELMASLGEACATAVSAGWRAAVLRRPAVSTHDATDAATDDATDAATRAATHDATDAATDAATRAATHDATYDATRAATRAATDAATRAATHDATDAATDDATHDATDAATDDATRAATRAATDDATCAATYAATHDATRAATYAATRAATRAATYDATHDATHDATDDATRAATRAATHDATDAATRAATHDATRFLLLCCGWWYRFWNGGNMWSGWVAYLSFFRHIAGLDLPIYDKWRHYETAAERGGPRYMHTDFWSVADRPECVHRDAQTRPHCADGPALRWRDGWALYYWHGIPVRPEVIDGTFAAAEIDLEQNAEVRRCMVEKYGADRYLRDTGAKLVKQDEYGKLWRKPQVDDEDLVMVEVRNSTPEPDGSIKDYWLRVPPTMTSPHQAIAWTFGIDKAEDYKPSVET